MKVLFIGPDFYNYEKLIVRELENRYDYVYYLNEFPYKRIYYDAIKRVSKNIAKRILNKYNDSIIEFVIKKNIDIVLIIRGAGINESTLSKIRERKADVQIINYQWDSIKNNPNALLISKYADRNYTFDHCDALLHKQFRHLPLFYFWEMSLAKKVHPESDLFFLGSYHSNRHLIIRELKKQCEEQNIVLKTHIYIPLLVYIRKKILGEDLLSNEVCFKKLSRSDYFSSICNSKIIVDIASPGQAGATIRTIETLSLERKLLSTNIMLKKERFYSPQNIILWNGKGKINFKEILQTDFYAVDNVLLDLNHWLNEIGL